MKIEEAIVYVMVQRNGGMTTDQIAESINRQRLHLRKDGKAAGKREQSSLLELPSGSRLDRRSRLLLWRRDDGHADSVAVT